MEDLFAITTKKHYSLHILIRLCDRGSLAKEVFAERGLLCGGRSYAVAEVYGGGFFAFESS